MKKLLMVLMLLGSSNVIADHEVTCATRLLVVDHITSTLSVDVCATKNHITDLTELTVTSRDIPTITIKNVSVGDVEVIRSPTNMFYFTNYFSTYRGTTVFGVTLSDYALPLGDVYIVTNQ